MYIFRYVNVFKKLIPTDFRRIRDPGVLTKTGSESEINHEI